MNVKNKLVVLVMILCMLFVFGSCNLTQPINYEKFKSTAESMSLSVTLYNEKDMGHKDIREYAKAVNADETISTEYIRLKSSASAVKMYEKLVENMDENAEGYKVLEPESISPRYRKITMSDNNNYYNLTQVDDCILFVYGPSNSQDSAVKLVESMGY